MPLPPPPLVGTCGFAYQEWRGRFYPPELPDEEWLAFYAGVFDALELDGTFYRPPAPATVERWASLLPETFAIAAKVPRVITHELRLAGAEASAMLRVFGETLTPFGDRLLAVLLQLPPSLDAAEGRERLAALLEHRPSGLPVVVEVRHASWQAPWLADLLERTGAVLAVTDRPGAPPAAVATGSLTYLRLLGDRREIPEIGVPVRNRGTALDRWAERLLTEPSGRPAVVFVNNRYEGAAFTTAAAIAARLGRPVPDPLDLWREPPLPGLADWQT